MLAQGITKLPGLNHNLVKLKKVLQDTPLKFIAGMKNLNISDELIVSTGKHLGFNETDLRKWLDEVGEVGVYTAKIKWGIHEVDVRPFSDKGFWGTRISQSDPRVDAFELKINPNNESFYVPYPDGGYVQFEGLISNTLKDGKLIKQVDNSIYNVLDKPEFLRQKILDEALRQLKAAESKGLSVEWLVS